MSSSIKWQAAGCALAFAIAAAPAAAQSHDPAQHKPNHDTHQMHDQARKTNVNVTTEIRLPGVTLAPGTYVFKVRDGKARQNVVEVWSTDGKTKIGSFLTVEADTPMVGTNALVTYENSNPPVLRTWYFPGDTVGRTFVYTEDEARTIYTAANTPVLYATWDPDDDTVIGAVGVQSIGSAIGQAAKATADVATDVAKAVGSATKEVAKEVADKTEDVWDDLTDNARLVNPTPQRKAAEQHLDAAEKVYDDLEDRLGDDMELQLKPMRMSLESLENAFERGESWTSYYNSVMASLDALSPERPVGTSGSASARLDSSTHASLMAIRGHLKAFHAQATR